MSLAFSSALLHDVLGHGDDLVAGVPLFSVTVSSLVKKLHVLLQAGHVRVDLAGDHLILFLLGFELAAFLAGVFQDLAGAEARGQHAQTVAPFGVHGAGHDLVRHRSDDQLDQAVAGGDLDLAGDQGVVGIDRDLVDPALGDLGGRLLRPRLSWPGVRCLSRVENEPAAERRQGGDCRWNRNTIDALETPWSKCLMNSKLPTSTETP